MDDLTNVSSDITNKNVIESLKREHREHQAAEFLIFDAENNELHDSKKKHFLNELLIKNVPDVPNVPLFDLSDAIDPNFEELQNAINEIEKVIAVCKNQPGALFKPPFIDALKIIRNDPGLWADYRVKIKKAKPSGVLLSEIDALTRLGCDFGVGTECTASALIELVIDKCELFFDDLTDTSFVSVEIDAVIHTLAIGSRQFIDWLSYSFYMDTKIEKKPGMSASESAIKQACFALSGIAKYEGEKQNVYLRVAFYNNSYFIFLGDERLRVVEVTSASWRILEHSPVKFWKSTSMQSLPIPKIGGDLFELWNFVNIPENDQLLVLAWMLECFRAQTPFPIMALSGQQGSAKSSTQNMLRQLIDNNSVNLRASPKSVEDVFVSAGCNWLASFENISHLTSNLQDALCTLATGGGFAARTLYTNKEETIIEVKRPVILNSIPRVITAQDLTDRAINIECPSIDYKEESEIKVSWEKAKPAIFGGLLDLFVKTLAILPTIKLKNPPRMADFTRLGEAMAIALNFPPGLFIELYTANRAENITAALESSPVGVAVRDMVDAHFGQHPVVFYGTVKSLYETLSANLHYNAEGWPRSPKGLSEALKRQSPALLTLGINIEQSTKRETTKYGRGLVIKISKSSNLEAIVLQEIQDENFSPPESIQIKADTVRL